MIKPKHKTDSKRNMELLVKVFENNYDGILIFLGWPEQQAAKLICRGIYYISITSEVWTGLRLQVLDRKMQLFEDIDFVEQQPKVISKQQKQIRIHSLKKNVSGLQPREASNIKQKKVALNTINNELPFRSTQIGFKRLMRSTLQPKQKIVSTKQVCNALLDLAEIPKEWSLKDLIINVKDPWSVNLQRAANLISLARKWNEFHHKIVGELKEAEKDLAGLIKKCIKIDKMCTDYLKLFSSQPYKTVRQLFDGAQQQLLIDDQLNKLGKIFVKNHEQLVSIGQSLEFFISRTHELCNKLNRQNSQNSSTWILQGLSALEQLIQQWTKISKNCPELIRYLSKSLLQIIDGLLQDFNSMELELMSECFPLYCVDVRHLSRKSDYFEVLFQSYEGVAGGVLRLCEGGEEENMGLNLITGKFKNLKVIAHCLWSISKYFSKLNKQLQSKEKKSGSGGKGGIIKKFLQSYQNYKAPSLLLDWKNPAKAQKQVLQLKQRVNDLKGLMQGE